MEPSTESTLVEFIRYNNWANSRLFEACQGLSAEQWSATVAGTYGTLRDTLVHIVRGEASYAQRLTGERPPPPFQWDDQPSVSALSAYADQVGQALIQAASHVAPTAIVREEFEGQTESYKAMALFIQIVNHGVEHRTHMTTILTQLGLTPPEVDGWGYLTAYPERLGAE
jgi:uncharacterized damage-inducible protein DinB